MSVDFDREPLSPLLFVIAMDVLTAMMVKAQEGQVLSRIPGCLPMQRLSLHADDVVLFIRPTRPDLMFVKEAIMIFGEASGLRINFAKSSAIMIRAEEEEEELVKQALPWKMEKFPFKYLGLQLGIRQLTRLEWQPIVDDVLNFVPGTESVHGGECSVAWQKWEWLKRPDSSRPWQGLNFSSDKQVQIAFDSLVQWQLGEGSSVLFWRDHWLNGARLAEIVPLVVGKVRTQVANKRTVKNAMHLHSWTSDIVGDMSTEELSQFVHLWTRLIEIELIPNEEDKPIWPGDASDYHI
ncbi:uncharacterized protein [Aegilops tauschii subsp. strangulata]|uniref:uncharacterized protein n=1 Tax=Aegilops tauschii subsp. strangulata TaxID=200361 RepID=UPI003CC8B212